MLYHPSLCYRPAQTLMKHQAFHSPKARRQRVNDPEGPSANIMEIATTEFASKGFSGARVDDIAARTKTSKRMIYYLFWRQGRPVYCSP